MLRPRAKISLFEDGTLAQAPIAVPSRGSSLLSKTVSTTLDRETLEQVVVDGFFARTSIGDLPNESRYGRVYRNSVCPMLPIRSSASI